MTLLAGLLALAVAAPPKPVAELTPSGGKPADRWHPSWLGFGPDGKTLAARYAGAGGNILVWWSVPGWAEQRKVSVGPVPGDVYDPGPLAALTADGRCLVPTTGGVQVVPAAEAQPTKERPGLSPPARVVWVAADGKKGYTFGAGQLAQFTLIPNSRLVRPVLGVRPAIPEPAVALDPAARLLAVVAEANAVELWDVAGQKVAHRLTGHDSGVVSLAFSPDGKTLASGSFDMTVRLWDTATGKERAKLTGPLFTVMAVAFSADGKRLAFVTTDRADKPNLWLADPVAGTVTARVVTGTTGQLRVAVSPDGKLAATSGLDGAVRVWDVERLVAGGG